MIIEIKTTKNLKNMRVDTNLIIRRVLKDNLLDYKWNVGGIVNLLAKIKFVI